MSPAQHQTVTRLGEAEGMNASALFLERPGGLEPRELQPLPDASEGAWDRWLLDVCGPEFVSRHSVYQSAPAQRRGAEASAVERNADRSE
jgi:hypothetical protein